MSAGQRLLPQRLELDLADDKMTPDCARFIKNLTVYVGDTSQVTDNRSSSDGKYRPLESTQVLDNTFVLPAGYNHFLGAYSSKEDNCVLFHYYNENGNHGLYFINGENQTIRTVYRDACLNYQLSPEYFIHEGGAWLEVFNFNDPATGLPRKRSYYNFTDSFNNMRFICIEDSIATGGFNPALFPYFVNPHDKCLLINAGLTPPKGCMAIAEVQNDNPALQNNLRFFTWQFMVRYIDVYGRPSEWGDVSDLYIPGANDCAGTSELLPRCLDLTFDAGSPLVNIIEVAFRNCNEEQWYTDNYLFLYNGSNLGDWWLRARNPDINYNPETNEITYRFCKDKECNPIPVEETSRTQNPLPRQNNSVAKIGKFLGVGGNKHGFFPFDDAIMDEIELTVTPPTEAVDDIRNIEIYVPIINVFTQQYQPIYQTEEGTWVFGGRYTNTNQYVSGVATAYFQKFGTDDQKGFIGYLAGTGAPPNATISELYYVDGANNFVKVEDFNIVYSFPFTQRRWYNKFTFNSVPKGIYTFRIASHLAKTTDDNFDTTSTFVFGSFPFANKVTSFNNSSPGNFGASSLAKELEIDVCDSDYNSENDTKVLAIFDLTSPGTVGNLANKALSGYVYERLDPVDNDAKNPVELLSITANRDGNPIYLTSRYTDHNGFYFTSGGQDGYFAEMFGYCGCTNYKKLLSFGSGTTPGNAVEDFYLQTDGDCAGGYADLLCSRILITGTVLECDTDLPIPGVGVVYSRGGTAITGADGTFTIIAHVDNTAPAKTRVDKIYFVPTICPFHSCDDGCLEPVEVLIIPCVNCTERTIEVPTQRILFKSKRGLLSGGNYGVAMWGSDWLGRHQFAQTRDKFYFTNPTLIQTNIFGPSQISLTIPPDVTFPLWVDELKFGITRELSMGGEYITWIVDKVEFVDNTGGINNINPTQIKIYYGSLVEYNVQNNFNTTTGWQFIVQDEPSQINYTSDYVEFYVNGDGQFFPTLTRALIKYDQTGQYFLIDYDSTLKDLKPFAQIRLGRPLKCATKDVFYQVCGTIKVINGKAQQNTIVLNAFDTYYKYRQIPIPVGTTEEPENVVRTFGFPFEHHSPSDFWGDHCINIGKINSRNPYESEIIREDQIMLSGALSVNGQLNYLNWFDEDLALDFDTWNFGRIVSIMPFIGGIRCICEFNCFTVGFNDNTLRVSSNGQVVIPSADSKFGNPEVKVGNNFGCMLFDKNTIRSKDGLVQFLDTREGALMQDNYSVTKIVSRLDAKNGIVGGVNSWLVPKIKYIQEFNRANENKKYWTGTIDPAAGLYLLTDAEIKNQVYVNEERAIDIFKHETIAFDFVNTFFRQFIGYTPEGYGYIEGQLKMLQLFSFTNTVNYHYSTSPNKTYNTFYGTKCNRVIRPVFSLEAFQKKQPLVVMVMVNWLYFSDYNRTDSGQESRILIAYWKKGLNYFSGTVLCNLLTHDDPNTPQANANKITDGDRMYGSIFDIRLVGNPVDDDKYTEILGIIIEAIPDQKITPG